MPIFIAHLLFNFAQILLRVVFLCQCACQNENSLSKSVGGSTSRLNVRMENVYFLLYIFLFSRKSISLCALHTLPLKSLGEQKTIYYWKTCTFQAFQKVYKMDIVHCAQKLKEKSKDSKQQITTYMRLESINNFAKYRWRSLIACYV